MAFIPYLLSLLIPASLVGALWAQGHEIPHWHFLTPFTVLIFHPVLDFWAGDTTALSKSQSKTFSILLWLQVPLLYSLTLAVLARAETLVGTDLIALALGLGATNGAVGITAAHELIHRTEAKERALGLSLLALVNYLHYRIEHVFGHHKNVATLHDPATARRGESIYAFWLRALPTTYLSAWRLECHRIANRHQPWYSPQNRLLHYLLIHFCFTVGVTIAFGTKGLALFWIQSLVAVLFLELTNYVEHYGLIRERLTEGVYGPVTAAHSWDTNRRLSNWLLFNLGRHAHHHLRPTQPYQNLEALKESPKLPQGYSGLLLLVLIPPLWHRVMEKRLTTH